MNTPEGWKLVPEEPTQEMQSAAERYAGYHNRVPFSAGYYRAMLAAAPTPPEQPVYGSIFERAEAGLVAGLWRTAAQSCRKCGGPMKPGVAMGQTFSTSPDFPGDAGCTVSPGGPGELIDCLKCSACGWSVTTGKQPAAQGELTDEQIDAVHDALFPAPAFNYDRVNVRKFARAVIAAHNASRKRPEAEFVQIMEAVDAYAVNSFIDGQSGYEGDSQTTALARAEVERLVRGEKS